MLHLVPLRTACSELLCDVRVAAMLKLAELLRGPAVFDGPDFGLFLSREPWVACCERHTVCKAMINSGSTAKRYSREKEFDAVLTIASSFSTVVSMLNSFHPERGRCDWPAVRKEESWLDVCQSRELCAILLPVCFCVWRPPLAWSEMSPAETF